MDPVILSPEEENVVAPLSFACDHEWRLGWYWHWAGCRNYGDKILLSRGAQGGVVPMSAIVERCLES